ncbi:MAG: phosphotransferase family protein [Nocardioides sp.]|nr:phosphotransferase family protein [Nocardioides sp.]
MSDAAAPPGLDLPQVEAWCATHLGAAPPLDVTSVGVGQSNLTYRVVDRTGRAWALRRPPTGPLRPTAHDVVREARILRCVAGGPPVPVVAGVCEDVAVTGAPFYVMDFVEGVVLDGDDAAATLDPDARARFGEACVDALVAVHEVPPERAGLRVRRPDGEPYVVRQLRRWRSQVVDTGAPAPDGLLDVHDLLAARVPPEAGAGIVHGDFRPGNLVVARDGSVAAVLDWELCTSGDVLTDVGWLTAWWRGARFGSWGPQGLPGFDGAEALAARYAARTGRADALEHLATYEAFALWRLACIAHGVHLRFAGGQMGAAPESLDALAERPRVLVEAAADLLS